MTVVVAELKGITEAILASLKAQGIDNSAELLEAGKTTKGRKTLAETAGVPTSDILELVNRADLARVKGVGRVYADLLEEAGVDTVKELARRSPANLHAKIEEINSAKQLAQRIPTLGQVEDFVAQAKELPGMVEY
ncbi:hypothetical protein GCM10023189_00820 [Nibrella saemangeumensis]|uniref:DUF4332 domain-containing protein n=1 Tax=Nibrella saemangeumensis TaxID=1084526 RepID=A0ABP8MBV7_9BACT